MPALCPTRDRTCYWHGYDFGGQLSRYGVGDTPRIDALPSIRERFALDLPVALREIGDYG